MTCYIKALFLFALPATCLLTGLSTTQGAANEPTQAQSVQEEYHVWYKPPTQPGGATVYTVAKQNPFGYFHLYGPASFKECGAKMKALGVPGWEKY